MRAPTLDYERLTHKRPGQLAVWISGLADQSGASQTEVPEERHDSSPGQARNERRPGSGAEDDLLPFFWFGAPAGRRAKPEKGEGGYGVGVTQGGDSRLRCATARQVGGLALGY